MSSPDISLSWADANGSWHICLLRFLLQPPLDWLTLSQDSLFLTHLSYVARCHSPPIKLNDGHSTPSIAFGTASNIPPSSATAYISQALATGFTHIDTAQNYGTEAAVGRAIKASGVPRDKLYVSTKWSYGLAGKGVRQSCEESLEKMGLDYVDFYLIHDPEWVPGDVGEVWQEMEGLVKDGKAKSIGVSK